MATPSFPVDRLRSKPSSVILTECRNRCKHNTERQQLLTQVCERIHALHDSVAQLEATSPIKRKFVDVLVRFIKLTHRESLLLRLATSHTTQYRVRELHFDLDTIATEVEFVDNVEWQENWAIAGDAQRTTLTNMVTKTSDRILVNELTSEKQVEEGLMTLYASLNTDEPQEFLQFKRATHNRIRRFKNMVGLNMFNWFIPRDKVVIDKEACIGSGTFGDVWRGTLLVQNGEVQNVVIKKLYKEVSGDSNAPELFLTQLQFWNNLMENEAVSKRNILELYGGVHICKPQLYVCEDAVNGNLLTFLAQEENKPLFWKMFQQVAEGLKVLHGQNIIHGGLKCSNILVTADNTAKLSDFGFSFIRSLSIELSSHKNKAMVQSVRWKPKEMLEEMTDANLRFASDVYSLGMCMIEAITQEPPFGWYEDDEITNMIMNGPGHPRPDGASDGTWQLITELCTSDATQRLTLDQAVERITVLANNAPGA